MATIVAFHAHPDDEVLLAEGEVDRLYREAIARLGRTRMRPVLARTHRLYGERSPPGCSSARGRSSITWQGVRQAGHQLPRPAPPRPPRRPGAWRATLARSACYAVRWCEQAEGAGPLDGLGAAARAELLVQVPLMGLDGVHR
jgi:hypothetical protein